MENKALIIGFVFTYMAVILFIGYLASRRAKGSAKEFLSAGGKMPLWLTTATLLATFICGATILGGSGVAYSDGLRGSIPDPFGACLCLIIAGAFYLKLIRKTGAISAGSVYANRYGNIGAALASVCMIPTFVFFGASQVAAAGKIFHTILGWDFTLMAFAAGLIIILYTCMGGIIAIAWSDFLQIVIMVGGVLLLFPVIFKEVGAVGGHTAAVALMGKDFFSFAPAAGTLTFTGILAYLALWTGTSVGAVPGCDIIQRSLIAKNGNVAQKSGILSGIIMAGVGLLVVFIGAWTNLLVDAGTVSGDFAARIAEDRELLVPLLAQQYMPAILQALFLSAMLAAIMSTGDSAWFAPATIVSNDLLRPLAEKKGKTVSDAQLTRWTRYAVIGIGILSTLLGVFTEVVFDLIVVGFTMQGGMLFFPLTLGLYWKKANKYGAVAGMIAGAVSILTIMIITGTMFPELWVLTFIPLLVSLTVQIIVSLATQKVCPPLPLTNKEDGTVIKWPELLSK